MIYIYCFLASTFFAYLASRTKDKFSVYVYSTISIMILCLLGGLRDASVGTDTTVYGYLDYNRAASCPSLMEFLMREGYREKGYLFVCYVACKVFGHPNWAFFFYQLITIVCMYIGAYRHRKYVSLPFFMLTFCLMYYNGTLNAMRQYMACAILFMGLNHVEDKHYLRFIPYVIVACLFHASAIVSVPLFIILHMIMTSHAVISSKVKKFFIITAEILGLFAMRFVIFSLINLLPGAAKYSYYLNRTSASTSFSHMLILLVSLLMLTVYRKKADKVILPSGGGGINFYQANLIFSIMYYTVIRVFATRVLMYYDTIQLIVLAALPSFIREKHLKFIVTAGVVSVMFFSWWYIYVRGLSGETYPYKSIL